jgi:GTPase
LQSTYFSGPDGTSLAGDDDAKLGWEEPERCILVGVALKSGTQRDKRSTRHTYSVLESLEELGRLAETAGLEVSGQLYQVLEEPNPRTYVGSGKVAEITQAVAATGAETVIFDDELSPGGRLSGYCVILFTFSLFPGRETVFRAKMAKDRNIQIDWKKESITVSIDAITTKIKSSSYKKKILLIGQLRNLERALGGNVALCDRTALILDIFSQRAATREGKLQVDLAQSEYQLPRLTRMWSHLERQSGSGRVRGMGEKQIEVDRRLLRERVARLKREIEEVRAHRRGYRERRAQAPIPVVVSALHF